MCVCVCVRAVEYPFERARVCVFAHVSDCVCVCVSNQHATHNSFLTSDLTELVCIYFRREIAKFQTLPDT